MFPRPSARPLPRPSAGLWRACSAAPRTRAPVRRMGGLRRKGRSRERSADRHRGGVPGGDLADDRRDLSEQLGGAGEDGKFRPSTSILSTSGAGKRAASQSSVTVGTRSREPYAARHGGAKAIEVAGRPVASRDVEPGDRHLIGHRGGQHLHRRVPVVGGGGTAEQPGQGGVGLYREQAARRPGGGRRGEAEQARRWRPTSHTV